MKIKSTCIFILSLMLILHFTTCNAFAVIDADVDNDDLDPPTTVTSTTSASKSQFTTQASKGSKGDTKGGSETTTETTTVPADETSTTEAEQQNCEHNYVIVGFDYETGLATIRCSRCKYTYTDYFASHVTGHKVPGENPENYDPVFDVVNDGVINGKDYAYLLQEFYDEFDFLNVLDSHEFLFKEKFGIIYFTVLTIISISVMVLAIRRCR